MAECFVGRDERCVRGGCFVGGGEGLSWDSGRADAFSAAGDRG